MTRQQLAIVDYGMGNLKSVYQALVATANAKTSIVITSDPTIIAAADKIVFPGQGAAKACMEAINHNQLYSTLVTAAHKKPFLGICMGLQVLMDFSQENKGIDCLGILKGQCDYFNFGDNHGANRLKTPHMGWNTIKQTKQHPLWHNIASNSYFYFVHSYYVTVENANYVCGTTDYGIEFTSALAFNQLFAIQAHPEKSDQVGLQLYRNFINL